MKKKCIFIVLLMFAFIGSYYMYYEISIIETFKTNFPEKHDTLIIDHAEEQWSIPRNKKIDSFIRRSNRVSEHVGEALDFFILRFFLDGKQVYSIPYDEVGYPKNAVNIMNALMAENKKITK